MARRLPYMDVSWRLGRVGNREHRDVRAYVALVGLADHGAQHQGGDPAGVGGIHGQGGDAGGHQLVALVKELVPGLGGLFDAGLGEQVLVVEIADHLAGVGHTVNGAMIGQTDEGEKFMNTNLPKNYNTPEFIEAAANIQKMFQK